MVGKATRQLLCLVFFPQKFLVPAFAALPTLDEPTVPERFADMLTFYRPGARYPRRRWEEGPSEPQPTEEEKPLTPAERAVYIGFAIWVGFTFLALFVLVIFLHSPGNAN